MALQFKQGTFTAPASPGVVTVTPGFQAKVIIVFGGTLTAGGIGVDSPLFFGMASSTSVSEQHCMSSNNDDNVATTDNVTALSSSAILFVNTPVFNYPSSLMLVASISAIGSTTFDVDFSTTTSGVIIHYIALGGADLTDAKVMSFPFPIVTGNFDVVGAGFTPDAAIFLGGTLGGGGVLTSNVRWGVGAAKSSSVRWATSINAVDGATMTGTMNFIRRQRTDRCLTCLTDDTTLLFDADFVNFTSDGCTLNALTSPGSTKECQVLFLKGGQYAVGASAACTTSNCNQDVSVGFTPVGIVLVATGQIANTNVRDLDCNLHFGGGDGTNEGTSGISGDDAALNTRCDQTTVTTKAIRLLTAANPATVDGEADHSLTAVANSFRLTWTNPPAAASQICYVAFGDAVAAGQPTHRRWEGVPHMALKGLSRQGIRAA